MGVEQSGQGHCASGVPQKLDFEKITMPEVLKRTAERYPKVAALTFMGRKIAYRDLEASVNRFAKALMEVGVRAGDKVALLLPNMPQFVIADYAIMRIGAVAVMNDPLATEEDLTGRLNDSDAAVLITLDLRLPLALSLRKKTAVRSIIVCHITDYLPFPGNRLFPYIQPNLYRKVGPEPGVYEFLALLEKHPDLPVENHAAWEEPGAILYTAGTTGPSKGVMMTHANISCNTQQLRSRLSEMKDASETILAVFPFFHPLGWTGIQHLSILAGWTDILVPHPEPLAIIEIMKKHKPTLLPGMPAVLRSLLDRQEFRKMNFSSLKGFVSGGSPLSPALVAGLKALKDAPVVHLYGLTEIGSIGTATPWYGPEKQEGVGLPLPGTDVRIVDMETGTRILPAGESGEICFKGPQVMKGYYKKPEQTAAVLKEGWLFTGDIGRLDREGRLIVLGRKNDVMAAGGGMICPEEIDEALLACPQVLDACAIGIRDGQGGLTIKACVVLKPGETADQEEIIAHCRKCLAPEKVPQGIEFIDALPKSAIGAMLRREVSQLHQKKRPEKGGEALLKPDHG